MFNEKLLQELIEQAVATALSQQDKQEYLGLWSTQEFKDKTGISEWDLRQKLLVNPEFQKHVRQLPDSRKIYIDVAGATKFINEYMKVS